MAPEMDDTEILKTNAVDIWSLGCILYRMVAGSAPFRSRVKVYQYAITGIFPPEAVKNRGFSVPCEDFLRDVLQPSPGLRPSAEACLRTAWIMSKAPVSEYSIGRDLYSRLSKIQHAAPRLEPLSGAAVNLAVGVYSAPGRPPLAWRLNYEIGSGTFGTIFLEKVQTRGMESPELWAVKRISKAVKSFPTRRYQEEVENLQVLSNVSFVQTCLVS